MIKNQGFTLVELLVTMSLLSMIILIGSSAFSMFSQRWDGQLGNFDKSARAARNVMLVQNILDSLVPYVTDDTDGGPIIYFEGNRNGFVSVSSQSIQSPEDYAVIRFSVKQNIDLTFDVVYEEWPMKEELLLEIGHPLAFSSPMVLFESVQNPIFEYYGTPTVSERLADDGLAEAPHRWSAAYDGVEAMFAPIKAKLSFDIGSNQYELLANVATQPDGLLSRYQVGDDDCNC